MSETAAASKDVASPRPGAPAPRRDLWGRVQRGLIIFGQQREAAVFVVAVLLFAYFWLTNDNFFTKLDLINLSQIAAPIIIIAIGEVFLLICGEIDLSVGFIFTLAPFVMHYLTDFYGVPAIPAILLTLVMGLVIGWFNGFFTVTMGLPSFITTLATGFILLGIVLFTSHAEPAVPSPAVQGIGHWIGTYAWSDDHLGDRPHRDLPYRAHPDPVGPAHHRRGREPARLPARPASRWPGSSTATS